MNPWIGSAIVPGAVGLLFLAVSAAQRGYSLSAEWTRKLVHLGGGLIALSFPWFFQDWRPVVLACGASALAIVAMARVPVLARLRYTIGAVDRRSHGELYFPLAVLALFLLARGNHLLFVVPVLILTFADAAASIVGVRYGRTRFSTGRDTKTMEGSAACFIVAAVCTYVPIELVTRAGTPMSVTIAVLTALAASVLEAATTRGLDNLVVPLFVFILLHSALNGVWILVGFETAVILVTLVVVMRSGSNAFARRMRMYLGEMLPLPAHAALAGLIYLAIALFARRVHGLDGSIVSLHGLIGASSLFLLMLILRLMDELKDEDIDRELFPERPLPSGRVRRADIVWALRATSIFYLAINAWVGWAWAASALVLGYAYLMLRRFFAPDRLRRSLPLTLATHNPITGLMMLYGFAVVADEHNLAPGALEWRMVVPFVLLMWSPFLGWEIARKIRSAGEENAYVTYSQLLGRRRAVLVVWGVQAIAVACSMYLWAALEPRGAYPWLVAAGFGISLWAGARFLYRPDPRTSRLKPFAVVFLLCILAAQIIGFGPEK